MSIHLGLFYALRLGNCVRCTCVFSLFMLTDFFFHFNDMSISPSVT